MAELKRLPEDDPDREPAPEPVEPTELEVLRAIGRELHGLRDQVRVIQTVVVLFALATVAGLVLVLLGAVTLQVEPSGF